MVLYVINAQCTALWDCSELVMEYEQIVTKQMIEWCDDDLNKYNSAYAAPVDWTMVLYVSKMQIEAQGSY